MINGMVFYKPHSGISYGSVGDYPQDAVSMLSAALRGSMELIGETRQIRGREVYFMQLALFGDQPDLNVYKDNGYYYAHQRNGELIYLLSSPNLESVTFISPSWDLSSRESFAREVLMEYFIKKDLLFDDEIYTTDPNNLGLDSIIKNVIENALQMYEEFVFENGKLSRESLLYVAMEEMSHSRKIHNALSSFLSHMNDWDVVNELFHVMRFFDLNKKEITDYLAFLISSRETSPLEAYFFFRNGYDIKSLKG